MGKRKLRPAVTVEVQIDEYGDIKSLPPELQSWLNRKINDAFKKGAERTERRQGRDKRSDVPTSQVVDSIVDRKPVDRVAARVVRPASPWWTL